MILAHYCQWQYVFTALDSIFMQEYPRIELIVVDDGTAGYDAAAMSGYIDKHKRENVERVVLVANEKNLGTTRALNRALAEASGDYIHLFAADDVLANEHVFENFVEQFAGSEEETKLISAMAIMYDEALDVVEGPFNSVELQMELGTLSAEEQFVLCTQRCLFAIGGSCFRASLYREYGPFQEKYKLIEDWPFFLRLLRSGEKVATATFPALYHRAGGVSHSVLQQENPFEIQFREDMLAIVQTEIFPYLCRLPLAEQMWVYQRYLDDYDAYRKCGGQKGRWPKRKILQNSKALWRRKVIDFVLRTSNLNRKRIPAFCFRTMGLLAACVIIGSAGALLPLRIWLVFCNVARWLLVPQMIVLILVLLYYVGCWAVYALAALKQWKGRE